MTSEVDDPHISGETWMNTFSCDGMERKKHVTALCGSLISQIKKSAMVSGLNLEGLNGNAGGTLSPNTDISYT